MSIQLAALAPAREKERGGRYSAPLSATVFFTALLATSALSTPAYSNPQGGKVVGGSAQISRNGDTLTVKQDSQRAAIEWESFDIDQGETTRFQQPGATAAALNRVTGGDASKIMGRLESNGRLFLINPAGMVFGESAQVDVGSLVASTADMDTQDFMNGGNELHIPGNPDAAIINKGTITADKHGLVGLVAPQVINDGVIEAELGHVELASGDTATVDFYGDGLLEVAIDDPQVRRQLVANRGTIRAEGGKIAMTAGTARDVVDSLVSAEGEMTAPTVDKQDGAIVIRDKGSKSETADDSNRRVQVGGHLNAAGRDEGEQGGKISILGQHIALSGAVLDTSGHSAPTPPTKPTPNGTATMTAGGEVRDEDAFLAHDNRAGGSIKVGGDYLGTGDTMTAQSLYVGPTTFVFNDAIENGDAGRTIFWSDNTTEYHGTTVARGGTKGGHGGFVETSGKQTLIPGGRAILTPREQGYNKGTYLLDPDNITIVGNAGSSVFTDNSPVGHWDFESGSGTTALDRSSNNNDGTINGATFTGTGAPTPQENNNSLEFFGNDEDVEINGPIPPDGSTEFTISTWIKSDKTNVDSQILGTVKNDNGSKIGFRYDKSGSRGGGSNVIKFSTENKSNITKPGETGENVQSNNWTHIVMSWVSGNSTKFFINGNETQYTDKPDSLSGQANFPDFFIGRGINDSFDPSWDGKIDDVRLYNTSLSSSRIKELYGSRMTVKGLEELSRTADIDLQANQDITLDLGGDTLDVQNNNNISLTAANGNITDSTSGTITTSSANINLSAANGDVSLNDTTLEAQGGDINVTNNNSGSVTLKPAFQANNKTYDTTTDASGSFIGNVSVNGNAVTVDGGASFDDANARSDKPVSLGSVSTSASNFSLPSDPASDITDTADINKATLDVALDPDSYTRVEGESNPDFELGYSGFAGGEDINVINTKPTASTPADATSPPDDYDIDVTGGSDNNYSLNLPGNPAGTLTVEQKQTVLSLTTSTSTVTQDDVTNAQRIDLPSTWEETRDGPEINSEGADTSGDAQPGEQTASASIEPAAGKPSQNRETQEAGTRIPGLNLTVSEEVKRRFNLTNKRLTGLLKR